MQALAALAEAERVNPNFAMTYVYRGNVYEVSGDPRTRPKNISTRWRLSPPTKLHARD